MAHELIEATLVGALELLFHREPVALVEMGLLAWLKVHEDEVADEVGLRQLLSGGVHCFEDELGIVDAASKVHVDHH